MFTGLISEVGTVKSCIKYGHSYKLIINATKTLIDLKIGDSVAVNGACLTVVEMDKNTFSVDVAPETSKRTITSLFENNEKVNLERTLRLSDRLDGHIVSGHVEYVGTIIEYKKDEIAYIISIRVDEEAMRYIIQKGSIAVDGISLTVSDIGKDFFSVSVIPHTVANTTLFYKKEGSKVNVETDILGKYVEKLLSFNRKNKDKSELTLSKLLENGF